MTRMEEEARRYADLFALLSDPTRVEIIKILRHHAPVSPKELQEHFFLEQSSLSWHMSALLKAGIVKGEKNPRDKRQVFYTLDQKELDALLKEFQYWVNYSTVARS